jgi:hypothetical protein
MAVLFPAYILSVAAFKTSANLYKYLNWNEAKYSVLLCFLQVSVLIIGVLTSTNK